MLTPLETAGMGMSSQRFVSTIAVAIKAPAMMMEILLIYI
jgi:hypothetical protein